jgi:CheY-like chemotaxis protein/PAS domain-containing protein
VSRTLLNSADFAAWDRLQRPIWLFDPVGFRGLYANPAAMALWGAESLEELLSRDFSQLSLAVRTRIQRVAQATMTGAAVSERWSFYPRGEPVAVNALISSLQMEDGRTALLFEAAPVEATAEELRAVEALRHTAILITLFDGAGNASFANPAAFAAYGEAGNDFAARFDDPAQADKALADVLGGEVFAELRQAVSASGPRWLHLDARPVTDPATGRAGVLVSERDVTDQVEAERALASARQRAETAEAKHRFLTTISHELRTPLNAVTGFADLLAATELDALQASHLARVRDAGEQLARTINHLIDVADMDGSAPVAASFAPAAVAWSSDETAPCRVLCADDNEANRALVQAILSSQDIACELVCDGAEAVEAARGGGYDLILMDIQMPVMDGVAATGAIRRLAGAAGAVPILALTANTLAEQRAAYAAAGMQGCVAKPVNVLELLTEIARLTQAPPAAANAASRA